MNVKHLVRQVPFVVSAVRSVRSSYRSLAGAKRAESPGLGLIEEGHVVVRLADFGGAFELDARSHLFARVVRSGSFEPEAANAVRREFRGGDAIDVGANSGFYSVLFGTLQEPNDRVLAVEPVPAALHRLKANLSRNGRTNRTIVFEGAVGEAPGQLTLDVTVGREEYSSHHLAHGSTVGLDVERVTVAVDTLDELVERNALRPRFVKIDVEGAEEFVLKGARRTLAVHRPTLLVEIFDEMLTAQGRTAREVIQVIETAGYSLEWITSQEALARPR